ncbi:carbon monoxide dehydrogenase subunit G [Neobacillus niacini]|uniref:CoxG family protein n=1 Tax=Neobacillus niacini TaxID=86668 RepID=UPI0030010E5D
MNLSGTETFNEEVKNVWNALHNLDVLSKVIPGCESIELNEEGNAYNVNLKLGIAAVKGEYIGEVEIEDVGEFEHYILYAKGSGTPGHVSIKMDCKFTQIESGSILDWECDAEVGGMIAGVGSRVISGVAKFIAKKFFKDLKEELVEMDKNVAT